MLRKRIKKNTLKGLCLAAVIRMFWKIKTMF